MLRFGVIGLGRAGAGMLTAMAKHPDISVTAATDLYPEHLARFRTDFEGETFGSAEELCRSPNVDAVYIATPHQLHVEHVVAAAAQGKHIIVEKPMALTLVDCDRMIEAAEGAGVKLVVGHTASFNPGVQKMRELVVGGTYGRLAMLSATAYTDFLYRPRRPEELVTQLGGGIIFNQVPHQVDAARYLAGGIARSVRALAWQLDPNRPTEGCYLALIGFEGGVGASLVYSGYDHFSSGELTGAPPRSPASYGAVRRGLGLRPADEEADLRRDTGFGGEHSVANGRGEGGSLLQAELGSFIATCEGADLRLGADGVLAYTNEGLRREPPVPWRGMPGRGNVIDELYYAATEDRQLVHDGRWAKATMEVCFAILQSAQEQREVRLSCQVPTRDLAL